MEENEMNMAGAGYQRAMGAFPPETPIGMAYVPVQRFQSVYDPDAALAAGTIFPELNKPWLGSRAFAAMPVNPAQAAMPTPQNQALYNMMMQADPRNMTDYERGNEK